MLCSRFSSDTEPLYFLWGKIQNFNSWLALKGSLYMWKCEHFIFSIQLLIISSLEEGQCSQSWGMLFLLKGSTSRCTVSPHTNCIAVVDSSSLLLISCSVICNSNTVAFVSFPGFIRLLYCSFPLWICGTHLKCLSAVVCESIQYFVILKMFNKSIW